MFPGRNQLDLRPKVRVFGAFLTEFALIGDIDLYNEAFFGSLDGVTNALDNVKARTSPGMVFRAE